MDDWTTSEDGCKHIQELLRRAGTPLESQVARLCRDFCREHDGRREVRLTTKRLVYNAPNPEDAAREVDQSVEFDRFVDLENKIGVRLRLRVPIECKHRSGLAVFGFPRPRDARVAALPMFSDYAGAVLVNQLAYSEPSIIAAARECALTLLDIDKTREARGRKGPGSSEHGGDHREHLIENAGAALYDFIRAMEFSEGEVLPDVIQESSLLSAFKDFCEPAGDWFASFHPFVRSLSPSVIEQYNQEVIDGVFGGQTLYLEASLYVPVVCLDARMFLVPCGRKGRMRSFLPRETMMTGLRLKDWPGEVLQQLLRRRPETLVMISSISGVRDILASCLDWYFEMLDALASSEPLLIRRALVQGSLFRRVVEITARRRR